MQRGQEDSMDSGLKLILRTWDVGNPSAALDKRVAASIHELQNTLPRKNQPESPSSLEDHMTSEISCQEISRFFPQPSRSLSWMWRSVAIVIVGAALVYAAGRVTKFFRSSETARLMDTASGRQQPPTASGQSGLEIQSAATSEISQGIAVTGIQVRVIERVTGRPIANAALLVAAARDVKDVILAQAPRTDSDGRCAIQAPNPPTWLTVRAEGFVPRHLRLSAMEGMPHEYVFKLDRGSSIGGYIRDEDGKPLENVKLSIYSSNALFDSKQNVADLEGPDNWVYVQTDRTGWWAATELVPDAERIQLTLDHPERASIKFDTIAGGTVITGGTPIEHAIISDLKAGRAVLTMKSGLVVSGRVMDESGRGIEAGEIISYSSNGGSSPIQDWMLEPIRTDANGQFALRIPKAGEIMVYVQARGFAPEERVVQAAPGLAPVEFRLKRGEIVRGRVVDEEGNPIPNASISTGNAMIGRTQPFSWSGKTDVNGRFLWDSAPAKPLSYRIGATGYDSSSSLVLAPGQEHEIRLTKGSALILTGKVTDAATRMPIDRFKVSLAPSSQIVMMPTEGKGGEFTITLAARATPIVSGGRALPVPLYAILVEADGYIPDISQSVEAQPGNRYFEISLVRSNGISGFVLLPDGSPAANAGVYLCGGNPMPQNLPSGAILMSGPVMTENLRSIRCSLSTGGSPFSFATQTDASGRFSLKPVPGPHSFYAAHEKGFAAIVPENIPASGNITLQPWAQIAGAVMVGSQPGANQSVSLASLAMTQRPPALRVMLTTATDSEGRFEFTSVPPGEYKITNRPAVGSSGNSAVVAVRSGETATIRIGGTGRPLTGRIVAVGVDPTVTPRIQSASLALKLPDENIPSRSDSVAYSQWLESEAGVARLRAERSYLLRFEADNSFRLEDIPAGTYTLTVTVNSSGRLDPQTGMPVGLERVTKEIVVPEMPGGSSDNPLNLGVINLQIPVKK